MTDGTTMTLGRFRARTTRGRDLPPAAARIKQLGADLIDAIEELPENGNTETRRLKDIGAARAEAAIHWGVKAATSAT